MDNTRRREIYLRDRTDLTRAQRRRIARHDTLEINNVIPRMSRLRKAVERAARRQARTDGANLVAAIRGGWFSPRNQREQRAGRTVAALKAATQGPKTVKDDPTVTPR